MPPIQGFQLTTEDSEFDLPDPPDTYADRVASADYVGRDELGKYETR